MTAHVDLIIPQGATLNERTCAWRWRIDNTPVDLTGYTARAKVRETLPGSGASILNLTTENGGIVLGGVEGTIALIVPASITASLWVDDLPVAGTWRGRTAYRCGYWDLELIEPDATTVRRLMQGECWIVPEATR